MMNSRISYEDYLRITTGLRPGDDLYSKMFVELDSRIEKSGGIVEAAVSDLRKLLVESKQIGTIRSDRLYDKDVQIDLVQSVMPDFKKRYHSVRSSTRQSLERLRKVYLNRMLRVLGYYEDWDFLPKGRFVKAIKDELKRFYKQAYKLGVKGSGLTSYDLTERVTLSDEEERFVETAINDEMRYFNKLLKDYFSDTLRSTLEKRFENYLKTASTMYAAGLMVNLHPNSIMHWILNRDRSSTCPECLFMRENSPYTKYNLPVTPKSGFSRCLQNCRCSIRVVRADPLKVDEIMKSKRKDQLLKRLRELRRSV